MEKAIYGVLELFVEVRSSKKEKERKERERKDRKRVNEKRERRRRKGERTKEKRKAVPTVGTRQIKK